jgi:chorismate lyase
MLSVRDRPSGELCDPPRLRAAEEGFGKPGPYWGRHYLFWKDGKPLTLIYEVFSPTLSMFLGPPIPSPIT